MEVQEILKIKDQQVINPKSIIIDKNSKILKKKLSTGSSNFDKILNGGFQEGKKYLIFGANKTGKTQLCHQLCIQFYISRSKTRSNHVFYLDAENTFRPERLKQLADGIGLDNVEILKEIFVARIISNNALLLKLKTLEKQLFKTSGCLLIIDSINNFFRSEQGNKDIIYNKTKTTFIKILRQLNKLTEKFQLITIATAQVAPNFIDERIVRELPVGNQFLNHFFSEHVYLNYQEDLKSFAHLINSHELPEKKALYHITSNGIENYNI